MKRVLTFGVELLALCGCGRSANGGRESVDSGVRERAISVARDYVEKKHPDWRSNLPWAVWREGNRLHVVERLPEEVAGGGAVIILDDRTFRVVYARHEQ